MKKICFTKLPLELVAGTKEVLAQLGLSEHKKGTPIAVEQGEKLSIGMENGTVCITYKRRCEYFRALSYLNGILDGGEAVSETNYQTMLCLMADCSRNAVMSVEGVKRELRYLALMGFDSMMLYTEDTYEIEEYPYFGRMRGRYTHEELRELDDYAYNLGIELIPCIQALAHLERALQWGIEFGGITDTEGILLVGEEKTYEFIEAALKSCASCFRSDRINLGMDEAHNLGRGKYEALHGVVKRSDIMLEHLNVVTELCKKYDFKPMIWSDMFYRMAFNGRYYVSEGDVPMEVMEKVPEGLTLIYWDYYTTEDRRDRFRHMVESHLKFPNNEVMFAGGAWGWSGFAPFSRFSWQSSEIQLGICQQYGMRDWIITSWGDDGRECTNFASLPILLYYAEYGYHGNPDTDWLEKRANACFGIGFEDLLTMDAPNDFARGRNNPCKYLLFNDPLEGLLDAHMDPATVSEEYVKAEKRLLALADHPTFGYIYKTLASLCHVLIRKSDFCVRLRNAYLAGDRNALTALADEVSVIVSDLDDFLAIFRTQWMTENKPYGFSVQEIRIGALRARLLSTADRIKEYLAGAVSSIPELEEPVLPVAKIGENPYISYNGWRKKLTACIL